MNGFKSALLYLLSLYGFTPRGRRVGPIHIGRPQQSR